MQDSTKKKIKYYNIPKNSSNFLGTPLTYSLCQLGIRPGLSANTSPCNLIAALQFLGYTLSPSLSCSSYEHKN